MARIKRIYPGNARSLHHLFLQIDTDDLILQRMDIVLIGITKISRCCNGLGKGYYGVWSEISHHLYLDVGRCIRAKNGSYTISYKIKNPMGGINKQRVIRDDMGLFV